MTQEPAMTETPETAFAAALTAFQAELPKVTKDQRANAGTYGYSYADLTDVTEAGLPLLASHGLSFSAKPTLSEHGFVLRYTLRHVAGHDDGGDYPLPDPSKTPAQQIGSAITYARRYSFCAVTGIAPGGDDDDGAKANDARSAEPLPRAPRRPNATTRQNAEQLGDPATRPDEFAVDPVTDNRWLEDFRARLVRCGKPSEVRGLDTEAHVQFGEGKLTADDARQLKVEIDTRLQELTGELVSP